MEKNKRWNRRKTSGFPLFCNSVTGPKKTREGLGNLGSNFVHFGADGSDSNHQDW